ncbi:hypothetical protein [Sphingomonas sp. Leaf205]|uniref:hypothetical protein n=1 Tax=Sphingomonas sp. Leaf205 TaxID=2876551 RepID=UPI001E53E937|nr:hypothetical protein [Sphingomonas sp. Leaf205]
MKRSRNAERLARTAALGGNGDRTFVGKLTACSTKEVDVLGKRTIFACFAASGDMPPHEHPLSGLDPALSFAPLLRDAYIAYACDLPSISSRTTLWSSIRSGLLCFLIEDGSHEIAFDETLMARFSKWLDAPSGTENTLAVRTRRGYYRKALKALHAGSKARLPGLVGLEIDWRFDPWAGQHSALPDQEAFLSSADMTIILRACRSEAENYMSTIGRDLDDLIEGRLTNPVVAEAERLRIAFGQTVGRSGRGNLSVLDGLASKDETGAAAIRLLTPRIADLVPFILLMAHYTAFNASTLMGMLVADIERHVIGEARWVVVKSYKRRAGEDQFARFAIDDASTNPDRLMTFVERWTLALREWSGSGNLWIARIGEQIRELGGPGVKIDLAQLGRWLPRRMLPSASISMIRKGLHDLAHLVTDGNEEAVRAIGGQRSPGVVALHYTSPAALKREREGLALAGQEFERLIGSDGKIDARRLPDKYDRSAATPGFICLDRHVSPIPGEEPGRSCQAYGHCPTCPLAVVDIASPRSCGYLHLLFDRIDSGLEGNPAASAANYIGVWAPIARRLRDFWLPAFEEKTREAALRLEFITLPEIE